MSNAPASPTVVTPPDPRAAWEAQMRALGLEIVNLGWLKPTHIEPAISGMPEPPPGQITPVAARAVIYDGLTLRVNGGAGWPGAIPQPSGPWMNYGDSVTTECDDPTISIQLSGNVHSIAFDQTDRSFAHFECSTTLRPIHGNSSGRVQLLDIQIARRPSLAGPARDS